MIGSSQLDEIVPGLDEVNNTLDQWLEPLEQGTAPSIPSTNPDNCRWTATEKEQITKVLVLRDEDCAVFNGISPECQICRIPESDIVHVLGDVATLRQHPRLCGWKLRINEKTHDL